MCFLCSGISRAPSCFDPAPGEDATPGNVPGSLPPNAMNGVEVGDHAESTATTAVLTLGVSEYGTLSSATDEDWFRVELVAGQTYEFRLLGVGNAFLNDPLLRIRDSAGTQLGVNDDGFTSFSSTHERDSLLTFTATTTGSYYIEADAFSTETGSYLLTGVVQNVAGMVFTIDEIAWQLTNNGEAFFGSPEAAAFNVGVDGQLTVNITNLTAEGQTLARAALITWGDLTGIQFTETNGAAEITFDDSDAGVTAYANIVTTGTTITSSTVMVTTGWLTDFGTTFDSYSYETYIHEIGHALGFGHGGNYNGSATFGIDNYYLNDSLAYSIMSYMPAIGDEFGAPNTFVNADFRFMLTPVLADFVAIERLYGGSTNTRTGDTTYGYNSNTGNAQLDAAVGIGSDVNFMVHDNGGTDTLDFSGSSANQVLSLFADTFSSVLGGVLNLSISRASMIENAIGGDGNDRITGNSANNRLYGGGGIDTLSGGIGSDNLSGGLGADVLIGGNDLGVDYARYDDANYGNLTIRLDNAALNTGAAAGDTYNGIEGLVGGIGNDTMSGNAFSNRIFGLDGNDTIFGQGGIDTLYGGTGNDRLEDGLGASDILIGGAGNDMFIVHSAGTIIEESVGNVNDAVFANVSFVLAADDNIELLATLSVVGTTAINLSGNSLSQRIFGNAAANRLESGAGAADTLIGGAGNDTYFVRNSGTVIVENAGQGTLDTVSTSVSFTLAGDDNIEILTAISAAGVTPINLTGNALAQSIIGNAGANSINGGAGLDTLTGGAGADRFVFNSTTIAANVDRITDFTVGIDKIVLENLVFPGLLAGPLPFSGFASNITGLATDPFDRIIYESDTGKLFYDFDGNGLGPSFQFAVISPGLLLLSATDFVII